MLIMNQSKDTIYNMDKIISIEYIENGVTVQCDKAESSITLGTYKSESRAKEVLMELFEHHNQQYPRIFYMPEK